MRRLLPSPVLSLALFLLWLLLMQSLTLGNVLLGAAMGLFWPAVTARLMPTPLRLRKPLVLAALFARVVADMLRSNLAVARLILGRRSESFGSGFVRIPLDLRDPQGLAALAMIVTFTPGTAWAQLSADNHTLLLHVLALDDESALVAQIKDRYERPLREIFE
jgi:multicomponent K+:H+ antiporter subunit E